MNIFKRNFTIYSISFIIALALYWRLFFSFYQADEWQGIGHMLSEGPSSIFLHLHFFDLLLAGGRILTGILNYFFFTIIPYNIFLLASFSIVFHSLNAYLVYILTEKLFSSKRMSFFAMILFLFNSVGNQAVTWFAASISVLFSTFLILSSLVFLTEYLQKKQTKNIWIAYSLLFLSFYFKETGVFLLPFYLFLIIYNNKPHYLKNISFSAPPFIYFALFVLHRAITLVFTSHKTANYINNTEKHAIIVILINALFNVYSSFSQMFLPSSVIFPVSLTFIKDLYPALYNANNSILISQTIAPDLLSILFSSLLLFILLYIAKKNKNQLLFIIMITVLGILPYGLLQKGNAYLESRYYYFSITGISIILSYILEYFSLQKNYFLRVIPIILLGTFLYFHTVQIRKELKIQTEIAYKRRAIVSTFKKNISLNKNQPIIVFVESNKNYYIANNPLPFQQGTGYTILVTIYNKKYDNLNYLLQTNYLWDTGSEGYNQKYKYGYFYNKESLIHSIKQYSIPLNSVYYFYWDDNTNILISNNDKLREELKPLYK